MAGGEHHEVRTYTLLRNVCGGGVAPAPYKELAPLDPQSWGRCPQTPTLAVWQRAQYCYTAPLRASVSLHTVK